MAAVVYLMVMLQSSCASTCTAPDVSTNRKVAIADKSMADEDAGNRNIRQLVNRIDRLGEAVSRMQNDVTELDAYCRTIRPRDDTPTRVVTSSALSPKDVAALQKVPKLETFTRGLDAKLTRFMTQPQDVCQESHYRYGLYCYVIAEAGLSQSDARNWCTADFGSQASLAVVKDRFTHDFVASKLPNLAHSYWIGVLRQPSPHDVTATSLPPSSMRNGAFEYSDGTRVQRNVWQMWKSREGNSPSGNCASMTYDRVTSQWRWMEQDCSERMGYICQYFIMS
uniref:C-type lectin domain-containing protein n=1 Tax=Ciona savignyi TaxID=51511 RepID=H2Y5R4_CIOSA